MTNITLSEKKNLIQEKYTYMIIPEQYETVYYEHIGIIENPCIIGVEKIGDEYFLILEKYVNMSSGVNWLGVSADFLNADMFNRLKKIGSGTNFNGFFQRESTHDDSITITVSFRRDNGDISGIGTSNC